jgi:hypothetical protein
MIVCSCLVITDEHIEQALVEILSLPNAPLPTPGVVYRHLQKKMVCCGCSPLAVCTIYEKIDELAERGVVCPYACACAQGRLLKCASDTPAERLIERAPMVRRRRRMPAPPLPAPASQPTPPPLQVAPEQPAEPILEPA